MSDVGESVIKGLEEALAFAEGEKTDAVVHIPEEINVRRIRDKMKMTQRVFAEYFGFGLASLRDWEQGRCVPTGATRGFLLVIDREPDAVRRALVAA